MKDDNFDTNTIEQEYSESIVGLKEEYKDDPVVAFHHGVLLGMAYKSQGQTVPRMIEIITFLKGKANEHR